MGVLDVGEEDVANLGALVGVCPELRLGQEWVQDSKVGVSELSELVSCMVGLGTSATHAFALLGQVVELADEDVDEDAEVISVEVLVGPEVGEEQVEDLEDEQRDTEPFCRLVRGSVEDEDQILAERLALVEPLLHDLEDDIGVGVGCMSMMLLRGAVAGRIGRSRQAGDHVLLVQADLQRELSPRSQVRQ